MNWHIRFYCNPKEWVIGLAFYDFDFCISIHCLCFYVLIRKKVRRKK